MEYYNKTLCVTHEELCGGDVQIIKPDTLIKNVLRGNIRNMRRGAMNVIALYAYDSLPRKYKEAYVAKYGSPDAKMKADDAAQQVVTDEKAAAYYRAFEYDLNGVQTHLSKNLIEEYTRNASVLNRLLEKKNERIAYNHKCGNGRVGDLWKTIHDWSEELRGYGHTLPNSVKSLQKKMSDYKRDGYKALINGRIGNSNSLKLDETAQRRLIALKRQKTPVLTDKQIFEVYNEKYAKDGIKPLKSIRSLVQWLNGADIAPLWWDAVYGEMAAHQKFDRKHKTALPMMRDALWYGDGTKLNLYYRGDDGKVRTTSVYEVIDAYSEVFLGFHISDNEDYEAQYHSYRMAVQVAKHRPYEIVHDNQGGHKKLQSQDFFEKLCRVHRTTAPYNGASKTIESVFGRFQQQVLHKDWRFTGQNITAKKENSRANVEFIEANKGSLYTLEELKEAYVKARTEWNEAVHPATGERRIDMYNNSVNPETQPMTVGDMVEAFWVTLDKEVTFTSAGLTFTVKGKERTYEVYSEPGVPDMEWRKTHTYQKFVVKYDPYDFESVRLYWKDKAGQLRFERTAEPYMVVHRALQEQQEGEAKFIRDMQSATEEMRIHRVVTAKEIEYAEGVAPEQNGLVSPKLKGVRAEVQKQIERRTEKYAREPEELSLGRVTKTLSLKTWDELPDGEASGTVARLTDGEASGTVVARAAGKL